MPFIGNQLSTSFQNVETQTITGDGSTAYTLNNAVADGKDLLVYINNVKQEEGSGKSYTATGTTITFSDAVASTDSCYVVFIGQAVGTVTPKDGSIVSSMLADANLEMPNTLDLNGKELILDADADTSITADTDDRVDIKIAGTDTVHVNLSGIGIKTTSGSSFTQNASSDLVIGAGSGNSGMTLFSGTSSQGAISFADGTASDNTQYRGYINYAHNLDALLFGVSGAEKVRIDSSGNVLVGTTASTDPATNNVANGIRIAGSNGRISASADGTQALNLNRKTDDGEIANFRKDGTTVGIIGKTNGQTDIYIGSGDVGLRFGDSIDQIIAYDPSSNNSRDDAIDLGRSNVRFDDIFATNGTIQTSDQNEKQDIASATEKELNVAKKLSALFKTFRWKDKVAEKGDKARTHTGIVAQEVQSAFKAEGLDASSYGLFTSDTWWEKEISVDAVEADEEKGIEAKDAYTYMDTKEEKTDGYTEKTRLGVRYPELFSFIFSSIEARLTALEAK